MRIHFLFLILIIIRSIPGAVAQPVKPLELVKTELFELSVPADEGWVITKKNPTYVNLSRGQDGSSGTMVAMVVISKMEKPRGKEHFLDLIRSGIVADNGDARFRELKLDLAYEEDRGYPCVRMMAEHEDLHAKLLSGKEGVLIMQMQSLYCVYPYKEGVGYSAGYSFRGEKRYDNFDKAARKFIEGVSLLDK
jgi:hypothetical protein